MSLLLLASLLASPAAAAPSQAEPAVPVASLISIMDYPASALRAGEQGTVRVGLDISPEGRVTACTVTASSRSATLDATACRILRARARFRPARDAAGTAVPGRYDTAFTWSFEDAAPDAR
jgi:protein TonB